MMFLLPFEVLGLFAIHCHEGGEPCVPAKAPDQELMNFFETLQCPHKRMDDACKQLIEDSEDKVNNAVIALIEDGGDVDMKDKTGNSLLYNAALFGYAKAVEAIAEHGSSLYDYAHPYTPLMAAAVQGYSDIVKILLKHGGGVNIRNQIQKEAAIHLAVKKNHLGITEDLIEAGADINLGDWEKYTPLHLTAKYNFPAMAQMLIEKGANLNLQSKDRGYLGYGHYTPLAVACMSGHNEIAKILLDAGADPNIGSVDGTMPLHCAAKKGNSELARALIIRGAKVNAQITTSKKTALVEAASKSHREVAMILLDAGADPNIGSLEGDLPLHYAAINGKTEFVRALISSGADVNAQTLWTKRTALMEAATYGRKDVINLLLENGADASLKDIYGYTARF